MPVVDFGRIEGDAALPDLLDAFAKVQKALDYLMQGGLDSQNIRAKSIVADRMDVQKLSAISADLGKVIAGILIGAYISTADGTYPRIDFSSSGNLLAAYSSAGTYVGILPTFNSVPTLVLVDTNITKAFLNRGSAAAGTTLGTFDTEPLNLQPSGPLQIGGVNGYNGPISYVKDVVAGVPVYGTITVTKGIITSVV